jgi:hypothetical protein
MRVTTTTAAEIGHWTIGRKAWRSGASGSPPGEAGPFRQVWRAGFNCEILELAAGE